ncbi:Aminodeoxychorismate synthase, chloroplastic [Gracilariopsis chorda]|uniref:aminodeoxychorismate synthase n=1 Tax=Gracilariopsis chorda TaxID=448386 RepID=A0A2V3IHH4_9FLOR|nr:Aminodeoxychorismate synthase, chloroplastic [Gracilariopsis chorda]|eukprot:PXF41544.1 Aminodeoxychorismate synthase, chloroplastic [Gracilariopsis chorda]
MPLRLALIDNYDSYTYNLAHLLATANAAHPPIVFRSDEYPSLADLLADHGQFDAFILSPGPGTPVNPRDFPPLQREILAQSIPTLAVCLGHQALCYLYGANVIHAPHGPRHGVVSQVLKSADECALFRSIPDSFKVVRYHSLCVQPSSLPECIIPTLWTRDCNTPVLMAVRHVKKPLFGLQFHPESVATEHGPTIAQNFLTVASSLRSTQHVPRPVSHPCTQCTPTFRTLVRSVPLSASPLLVFTALYADQKNSFWLDSSTHTAPLSRCSSPEPDQEQSEPLETQPARFSLMGACDGPLSELVTYNVSKRQTTVRTQQETHNYNISIFDYLKKQLKRRYAHQNPDVPVEMNGGYVGFFGYETKRDVDDVIHNTHVSSLPDAWFIFADRFLVFDHLQDRLFLVALARNNCLHDYRQANSWFEHVRSILDSLGCCTSLFDKHRQASDVSRPPLCFVPERSRSEYLSDIRKSLRYIHDGDSYEICLTNRLRTSLPPDCKPDPLELYSALRLVNPSPYSAFLRLDADNAVCCSSPERYLHISSSGLVESKPIKGTLPRGRSFEEDARLRNQLKESPKDRSENLMIVDLVRNDLSRICEVGSVTVPKLMRVESYATVHQLVSTVRGTLASSTDAIDCVRGAYPMGSMTGAPKVRTMDIIDRLETSARGVYSGSIGYLSVSGAVDLNVVIRTAVLTGFKIEVGVGGAIVAMSNPEDEYDEAILKGSAIMKAVALQVTGSSDVIVVHEPECCTKLETT